MANTAQASKRARQARKRASNNVSQRSRIRTMLKKALNITHSTDSNDPTTAQPIERATVSLLDKMACRGLIHKNKAARLKSRLARKLKHSTPVDAEKKP